MITWRDLKPFDRKMLPYARGTYQTFGLQATLTLVSPLLNLIIHFHRFGKELKIPNHFDKE